MQYDVCLACKLSTHKLLNDACLLSTCIVLNSVNIRPDLLCQFSYLYYEKKLSCIFS